ncbi:MAG: c-type cytochrome [Aliihoeflea sp.]|uniref:c-type cytochrome n=1 Tax=Aliihoeflea sp. TaxID=2608088 RepID=UPI0040346E1E
MNKALLLAGMLGLWTSGALADDPAEGRKVAARCQACHGIDGIAKLPIAPNLAGESAGYLETQLKAFKDGKRENAMMTVVVKDLTAEQIADVAAWYESIEVTVKLPE